MTPLLGCPSKTTSAHTARRLLEHRPTAGRTAFSAAIVAWLACARWARSAGGPCGGLGDHLEIRFWLHTHTHTAQRAFRGHLPRIWKPAPCLQNQKPPSPRTGLRPSGRRSAARRPRGPGLGTGHRRPRSPSCTPRSLGAGGPLGATHPWVC